MSYYPVDIPKTPTAMIEYATTDAPGLVERRRRRKTPWQPSGNAVTLSEFNASSPFATQDFYVGSIVIQPAGIYSTGTADLFESQDLQAWKDSPGIWDDQGSGAIALSAGSFGIQSPISRSPAHATSPIIKRQMDAGAWSSVELNGMAGEIADIFRRPHRELFEPGMISSLSTDLLGEINKHGNAAVFEAQNLILNPSTDTEVAAEAVRWLGRSEHGDSRRVRRLVLKSALSHLVPEIRDAAILGLASLDDPDAVPGLVGAMKREPLAMVRADIQQVIDQLQDR